MPVGASGNFIGLDSSGTGGSGVTGDGVNSQTGGNMIGGPTSDARNVIALNGGDGVDLSDGDIVQGNFIGTDATGSIDLGGTYDLEVGETLDLDVALPKITVTDAAMRARGVAEDWVALPSIVIEDTKLASSRR